MIFGSSSSSSSASSSGAIGRQRGYNNDHDDTDDDDDSAYVTSNRMVTHAAPRRDLSVGGSGGMAAASSRGGGSGGSAAKSSSSSSANSSSASGGMPLCCDACDGKHETADCPYFKKKRDTHRDAQKGKGPSIGGSGGNFTLRSAREVRQPGDGETTYNSMPLCTRKKDCSIPSFHPLFVAFAQGAACFTPWRMAWGAVIQPQDCAGALRLLSAKTRS